MEGRGERFSDWQSSEYKGVGHLKVGNMRDIEPGDGFHKKLDPLALLQAGKEGELPDWLVLANHLHTKGTMLMPLNKSVCFCVNCR